MADRSRVVTYGVPLVALTMLVGAAISILASQPSGARIDPIAPPLSQPIPDVAKADGAYIGATGIVESSSGEIGIGTPIAGIVTAVLKQAGEPVETGEPLFLIDSRAAATELSARIADLAATEARLSQTIARIPGEQATTLAAKGAADAAEAELADANDQLASASRLTSGILTERETTRRRNAARSAQGQVNQAKAKLDEANAELSLYVGSANPPAIEVDRAAINQARAALAIAQTNFDLLTVRSPIGGQVLQVNVRTGEFASAGVLVAPLLVVGQTDPLHVRIDVDEADISRLAARAAAAGTMRGDPAHTIGLSFVRIEPLVVPKKSLTGAGSERVDTRVLQVIYKIDDRRPDIFPGQQMDVFLNARPVARASADARGAGMDTR
jgi:multidrug resistance efflux pump